MAIFEADSLDGMAISAEFKVRETVTVSDICLHNVAVLTASLLRGMIDLEMGVNSVMATLIGPKLKEIIGVGLTINIHSRFASVGHFIGIPIMKDVNVVALMINTHGRIAFVRFFVTQFIKYIIDPDFICWNAFIQNTLLSPLTSLMQSLLRSVNAWCHADALYSIQWKRSQSSLLIRWLEQEK